MAAGSPGGRPRRRADSLGASKQGGLTPATTSSPGATRGSDFWAPNLRCTYLSPCGDVHCPHLLPCGSATRRRAKRTSVRTTGGKSLPLLERGFERLRRGSGLPCCDAPHHSARRRGLPPCYLQHTRWPIRRRAGSNVLGEYRSGPSLGYWPAGSCIAGSARLPASPRWAERGSNVLRRGSVRDPRTVTGSPRPTVTAIFEACSWPRSRARPTRSSSTWGRSRPAGTASCWPRGSSSRSSSRAASSRCAGAIRRSPARSPSGPCRSASWARASTTSSPTGRRSPGTSATSRGSSRAASASTARSSAARSAPPSVRAAPACRCS